MRKPEPEVHNTVVSVRPDETVSPSATEDRSRGGEREQIGAQEELIQPVDDQEHEHASIPGGPVAGMIRRPGSVL